MCVGKAKSKMRLVIQQQEAGVKIFKADIKYAGLVWTDYDFYNISLCKASNCFKQWHSQKG
jgi:hypothetical protein